MKREDGQMVEGAGGGGQGKRLQSGYLWIAFGALLFGLLAYFYLAFPEQRIGPVQPIYFSHRVHAGVKEINCRFCHPYVERSQNAGIPAMEKCFFCHSYVIPNHPQILKEKEHYESGRPVRWNRVFFVPDFVFFHHRPHIEWAGLDCSNCHGDVKLQDRLQTVNFQMGFCIQCHRKMGANLDCWLACHR